MFLKNVELVISVFLVFLFSFFMRSLYFFFFQAEDGIRDRDVTGVQTCALPISAPAGSWPSRGGPACPTPTPAGGGPVRSPVPAATGASPRGTTSTRRLCPASLPTPASWGCPATRPRPSS